MYMATPAPKVEPATVSQIVDSEPVFVEPAVPVEAPVPEKAVSVEPADMPQTPTATATAKVVVSGVMHVDALRARGGTQFEGFAAVVRGAPTKNFLKRMLPLVFDERDFLTYGEIKRFVVVKGDCCFVFFDPREAPLYAIPLEEVRPRMEDPTRPDRDSFTIAPTFGNRTTLATVLFKHHDGSQAYQFTFDTTSTAMRFYDAVSSTETKTQYNNNNINNAATVLQTKEGVKV